MLDTRNPNPVHNTRLHSYHLTCPSSTLLYLRNPHRRGAFSPPSPHLRIHICTRALSILIHRACSRARVPQSGSHYSTQVMSDAASDPGSRSSTHSAQVELPEDDASDGCHGQSGDHAPQFTSRSASAAARRRDFVHRPRRLFFSLHRHSCLDI
nr:uncharacterized protein LOC127328860 [Lolium perenne]